MNWLYIMLRITEAWPWQDLEFSKWESPSNLPQSVDLILAQEYLTVHSREKYHHQVLPTSLLAFLCPCSPSWRWRLCGGLALLVIDFLTDDNLDTFSIFETPSYCVAQDSLKLSAIFRPQALGFRCMPQSLAQYDCSSAITARVEGPIAQQIPLLKTHLKYPMGMGKWFWW